MFAHSPCTVSFHFSPMLTLNNILLAPEIVPLSFGRRHLESCDCSCNSLAQQASFFLPLCLSLTQEIILLVSAVKCAPSCDQAHNHPGRRTLGDAIVRFRDHILVWLVFTSFLPPLSPTNYLSVLTMDCLSSCNHPGEGISNVTIVRSTLFSSRISLSFL